MSLIPLTQIPTLTQLYANNTLTPTSSPHASATSKFNSKISLIRTDITKLQVASIVNAANESLLGGGGVDGAIHRAAGPKLLRECEKLDGCDTGSAKITSAYELPCEKVIHAVGPVYAREKRRGKHEELLRGCYTRSLDLASENGCTSIAFSALSTGVYGYPSGEAAETAIKAVKGWLEQDDERAGKVERIVFCTFLEKDERAYEEIIPKFFPPAATSEDEGQPQHEADSKAEEATAQETTTQPTGEEAAYKQPGEGEENPAVLDLPDVPTTEPTEEGEPEAKKAKLSSDDDAVGRKDE